MPGKFKLITGLGNKDKNKVKDLVLLWMEAGADIFDTSCSVMPYIQEECIKKGFNPNDFEFCVSTPITGDIHGKKAKIDPSKCKLCGKCKKKCIEKAIEPPEIDKNKCIGCAHCKSECEFGAIDFYDEVNNDLEELFKTTAKVDTVEIHISVEDEEKIINDFKKIVNCFDKRVSTISVCFNREYFSNKKTEEILKKLKELSTGFNFVVQADGMSMNLGRNTLSGTIETVAFALHVKSLGYEVILSGGCNEHTAKLAHDVGLNCSIGYGSFARKLTEKLSAKEAVKTAKEFVRTTKELMQ